jgi:hypothetical protein
VRIQRTGYKVKRALPGRESRSRMGHDRPRHREETEDPALLGSPRPAGNDGGVRGRAPRSPCVETPPHDARPKRLKPRVDTSPANAPALPAGRPRRRNTPSADSAPEPRAGEAPRYCSMPGAGGAGNRDSERTHPGPHQSPAPPIGCATPPRVSIPGDADGGTGAVRSRAVPRVSGRQPPVSAWAVTPSSASATARAATRSR